ncbi:Ceramide synthase 1 [Paragonimus heterotremus]|uniref:Ceramide synthase 1 n=1 Tax=Paragonimus heterotremus TaxID=100268 RepID=A0A8J4SPC1_9TREM|nr:Ceramide synthase 1 [Paragonimus heterotremus]
MPMIALTQEAHSTVPLYHSSPTMQRALLSLGYSSWSDAELAAHTQVPSFRRFFQQTRIAIKEGGGTWNCTPNISNALVPVDNVTGWNNILFFTTAFLLSVLLTRVRQCVSVRVVAWAKRSGVQSADTAKVSESVWKGTMHGLLWLSSLYVVILSGKHSFFYRPCQVWDGIVWNENLYVNPPAFDLQVLYALQLAHYLHTVYATLFVDTWRSDWIALVLHHVVTLSLISLSFIRRFLPLGALVLFIHDISDVLLEFTKLNVYFKWRNGKPSMINKYLSDVGFLLFALSWLVFRLYWFPMKLLLASNWCIFLEVGCVRRWEFLSFNSLMWILQFLHIYWFWLILQLLYKILTGKLSELEDIRESSCVQSPAANGPRCSSESNGFVKHKDPVS